jgi:argininosuccinate lyase
VTTPKQQQAEDYRGYRRAGIRLSEEPPAHLHSHDAEDIKPYLPAIHLFDQAHVITLLEAGLVSREHAGAILRALRGMEAEGVTHVRLATHGGMHSGEQYLVRHLGEDVGGRIHLGRSSGDLKEVSNRIVWRANLLAMCGAINDLRDVVLRQASEYRSVVMPGYSQGQQGQPTTYGHVLLSWAAVAARDVDRLLQSFERVNRSPAGAAIMTGSSFPIDRHRTAALLGFDAPLGNTTDAILSHDVLLELHAATSIVHSNVLRWSEDIMFWAANELGLITIPDRFCGTSSIMMQKKNPNTPQEIKGTSANAIGNLVTAFIIEKSPTGTAMIDRHASVDRLHQSMTTAQRSVTLIRDMVEGIVPNREVMLDQVWRYWAQATDIGAMLVEERNLAWRTAHQIVGILVRLAYERGLSPRETTSLLLDDAAIEYLGEPLGISEERYQQSLDPVHFVEARTLYGGPAPKETDRIVEEFSHRLKDDRAVVATRTAAIKAATALLESTVSSIVEEEIRP